MISPRARQAIEILLQRAARAVDLYTDIQQNLALIDAYGVLLVPDGEIEEAFGGLTKSDVFDVIALVKQTIERANKPIDPENRPTLSGIVVLLKAAGPRVR